jgi:hypothetical protein
MMMISWRAIGNYVTNVLMTSRIEIEFEEDRQ